MKTWVRKTLSVGILAAGALLLGSGIAHADVNQSSSDNNGIGTGTQIVAPITAPVTAAGIGTGILGDGTGWGIVRSQPTKRSGHHRSGGDVNQDSSDNNGILNGSQLYAPINTPVNVAGVGIGVAGEGTGAGVITDSSAATSNNGTDSDHGTNDDNGDDGDAGDNGDGGDNGDAGDNGDWDGHDGDGDWDSHHGEDGDGGGTDGNSGTGDVDQSSSDNNGIANGTQVVAPINAPVNVCGVGVGLLGTGTGTAVCGATGQAAPHHDNDDNHWDANEESGEQSDDDAPTQSPVDGLTGSLGAVGGATNLLNTIN